MSILEVSNVSKSFGGVKANVDISMNVEKGRIVGLIGPNGSGKTTLFNSIVGTYPIDNGSIKFNDKEVSELPVPVIAKLGLLRTFQQTRIYGKLNCVENMLISHKGSDESLMKIFSTIPKELTEKAENLLNFVGLFQKRNLRAGDLSFGQQKLLELAMALMNEPEMLLLDEPTNDLDVNTLRALEEGLENFAGCAVVISHDRWFLDRICTHILAFEGNSEVYFFEGSFSEYEINKRNRLGGDSIPKRIKYKKLIR